MRFKFVRSFLVLSFLATSLSSPFVFADGESLEAQIKNRVDKIEEKFKSTWAIQENAYPYQVSQEEVTTFSTSLQKLCVKKMTELIQEDSSISDLKFKIDFVALVPKGSNKREGSGGAVEFYKTTERYQVSGMVQVSSCETGCPSKDVTVDGVTRKFIPKCVSKPVAKMIGQPETKRLVDLNEFVSIGGWQP